MRIRSASSLLVLFAALGATSVSAQAEQRAWLGVVVEGSANGPAKVVEVDAGSPAAKAGLAVGDLILRFGNAPAGDVDSFIRKIQGAKAGARVVLTVRRGAGTRRLAVVLGSQADAARAKDAAKADAAAKAAEAHKAEIEARAAEAKAAVAERAAKEKAAVEARIAERKAEVEARLARQKAEVEARIAKQKAEVEAQIAKQKALVEAQIAKRKAEVAAAIAQRKAAIDAAKQKAEIDAAKQKADAAAAAAQQARAQGGRAFLGVTLELGRQGARIGQVTAGSAAQRAQLRSGDVIVEAAGKSVRTREQLVRAIQSRKPGDTLPLVIQRNGKRIQFDVVLGAAGGQLVARAQDGEKARSELARARAALQRAREARDTAKDASAERSSEWMTDLASAKRRARATGKPLLIDFTAKWSGPCRMLAKNFEKPELAEATQGFVRARIDVDKHESIADDFGVNSIPHVVLLSPEGKTLQKFTGYLGAEDLASRMKSWGGAEGADEDEEIATAMQAEAAPAGGKPSPREIAELREQVRSLVEAQKRMKAQLDRLIELIGKKNGKE